MTIGGVGDLVQVATEEVAWVVWAHGRLSALMTRCLP